MPNFLRLLSFYLRMEYYEFLVMMGFWNPYKAMFKFEILLKKYEEYVAMFPEFLLSCQEQQQP